MMAVDGDEELSGRRRIILIMLLLAVLAVLALGGWFAYGRYFGAQQTTGDPSADLAAIATAAGAGGAARPSAGGVEFPTFDVVRVTRGGAGLVTGHAPPGARVDVLVDGKLLGQVTADAKGEWILIFSEPLKSGGVELSLQLSRSFLAPDKTPVYSPYVVVVVVPEMAKDHFIDADGEGVVVIVSPRDRMGGSMIMQRPGRVTAGETTDGLGLDVMDYGDEGKAVLSGRAPAYGQVWAYVDNHFQGSATADQSGKWELELSDPLARGQHMLRADQVDGKGKVQLRLETAFERMEPLDPAKTREKIVVQAGKNLWRISRKVVADGYHYTLIFRADKDQVKDPELVYPGQVFDLPVAQDGKRP